MNDANIDAIRVHGGWVGFVLAGMVVGLALFAAVAGILNAEKGMTWVNLCISLFLVGPALLAADHWLGRVTVDARGVTRTGLFGRKKVLPWNEITGIRLIRNTIGLREMLINGRGGKIVLSSDILLMRKPGFWPAAFCVLDHARAAGCPIKAGWLGIKGWMYHGDHYLPGKDFEDRKGDFE